MDPKQLREIVGRATPGRVSYVAGKFNSDGAITQSGSLVCDDVDGDLPWFIAAMESDADVDGATNAAAIAALRNHAEALLDVVEAARAKGGCVFVPATDRDAPPCRQCSGCILDAALARLREVQP